MKASSGATVQLSPELGILTEHLALYRKQLFSKAGWYMYWFIQLICVGIYWKTKIFLHLSSIKRSRQLCPRRMPCWLSHESFHMKLYISIICISISASVSRQASSVQWNILFKLLVTSGFIRSIIISQLYWKIWGLHLKFTSEPRILSRNEVTNFVSCCLGRCAKFKLENFIPILWEFCRVVPVRCFL